MWASWDTNILQTFPAPPLPVALCKCTGVRCVFYRAGCEATRRYSVSTWWIQNCWDPCLGLGFGSVMTRVWMSLYILITGFISAFHVLFPTWSVKALLIKISIYLTTWTWQNTLRWADSLLVAGSQLTQGKSEGNWWKQEPLEADDVWWLLTGCKQVTLHHMCESHLDFGRKRIEGKADISGKSDLMETMV